MEPDMSVDHKPAPAARVIAQPARIPAPVPAQAAKVKRPRFIERAEPYALETARNILTVVVSVAVLAVVGRVYLGWEAGRQAEAVRTVVAEQTQAAKARNLARQAEIQREMDR
jgi:hypothetical protein